MSDVPMSGGWRPDGLEAVPVQAAEAAAALESLKGPAQEAAYLEHWRQQRLAEERYHGEYLEMLEREVLPELLREGKRRSLDIKSGVRPSEKELAALEEKASVLTSKWKAEKEKLGEATTVKAKRDQARAEVDRRMTYLKNVTPRMVPQAGHMLHHDQPELLAGMVEPFGVPMSGAINSISYTLWAVWSLVLGVVVLREGRAQSAPMDGAVAA